MTGVPHPLYLVRHGESEWNARELIQGQTVHPGLTAAGREQAYRAAERIRADLAGQQLAVAVITTSDLARAVQTAAALAEVLGGRLHTDVRLREQHLGQLQGMAKAQARQLQERGDVDAGESDAALRERMVAAVADLDRTEVQVVVSHRRALRQLTAHLLGLPDGDHVAIPNGAVARWHADHLHWLH
jgi:probable phosphoglycerate mutase